MEKNGAALNDGSWHTMSGYVSTYYSESEYRSYDRVAFGINDQTENDTMDVKEFMVINLTEAFGRGSEPNKSWCDNNISFFEGTTIIHQSVPGQGVATAIKNIYVGIPKNCKLVSYIESTGTQYIDTDVVMTSNISAEIDFQLTSIITSAHNSIITSYVDNAGTGFVFAQRSNTSNFAFAFGSSWNSTEISADLLKHTARINIDGKCYFDDQVVVDTVGSSGLSSNRNILLYGWQDGNTTNVNRLGYSKIYSCKIYDGNVLVRDLIPILDENNVPCFYDRVEEKFYYNAGTGTFKYGYEINNDKKVLTGKSYTPIEYAQSTGTQYIDTGFKHNQNTRMVAEIELLGGNAWINIFGSWGNTNNGDRRMMGVQCNTDGMGCVSAYYGNGLYNKWTGVTGKTTFDFNKNVYTIKGTSYTFSTASFQSLYNDYIFTASGYNGESGTGCAQKLYSFKIYDNGRLIRDYIPVKDENDIVCLFDKISNNFYYNQGTGDLTAGPVTGQTVLVGYEPLNYIESNGTQYINTNFYANNNTHIQLKAVPTKFEEEWQCIFSSKTAYQQNEYVLQVHQTNNNWYSSYGTNDSRDVDIVLGEEYICDKNKNITNINGTIMTLDSATFTATQPGYIFADNENGVCHFWRGKLYYLKIYDDTTLVRDFIPVLTQGGIVGLYDQLNNKFYISETNNLIAGSSEFNTSVARKVRRGYVGVKGNYTKLGYLEGNGAQYINTEYHANNNTKIEMKVKFTDRNVQECLYCSRDFNGSTQEHTFTQFKISNGKWRCDYSVQGTDFSHSVLADTLYTYTQEGNIFKENDVTISTGSTATFTTIDSTYIFASHNSDASFSNYGWYRLYSFKIWDGGVLVRDFIPILDDNNIPCLYDKVNYRCYYNKGSGTFGYGYEIDESKSISTEKSYTPIEYIQSTGTQWIDTGFNVTPNTRLTMSMAPTSNTKQDWYFGCYDSSGLNFNMYFNNSSYYAFSYQDDSSNTVSTSKSGTTSTINVDFNGKAKTFTLSGGVSYSHSLSSYTATKGCKNNLYLFAGNGYGSATAYGSCKMKLYSCKIYNDGVLVRNFIPVKDENNVACLFDSVSSNFFYNAGTGTFTAGPETGIAIQTEYQPINYIESTVSGHQYINTAIQGAAKIEMKMKFKKLNPDSSEGNNALIWAENSAAPWGCNGIRYALYGSATEDQKWQIAGGTTVYYNYPEMDTEYILEGDTSVTDDTVNYSLRINNELVISGSNTATLTSNPLYLFASNQNVFPKHYSIIQLYYCKFWDGNNNLIKNFIPVLNYNGQPCLYDTIGNKFYENLGKEEFSIEKTSDMAVSTIGIAREFYHVPRYVTFTSSIAPTSWSSSTSTAANSTRIATNSWGTWTITNLHQTYSTSNNLEEAFDNSDSTYARSNSATTDSVFTCQLWTPANISIKPTKAKVRWQYTKANSYIKGYNGVYNVLYTAAATGSTATTFTPTITTNDYYTKFEAYGVCNGSRVRLYDFRITSGIVADDRL